MTDIGPLVPNITASTTANSGLYTAPPISNYWANGISNIISTGTTVASQTVSIPFNFGQLQQTWVNTTSATNNATWMSGTANIIMPLWVSGGLSPNSWQVPNFWPQTPSPIPKEAEIQAKELLKEFIGEEGLKVLENGGVIRVGGEYEIDSLGNCYKLLPDSSKKRFCIVPDESMAWGDVLVNKIVPLICNPEECERVANWKFN